MIPLWAIALALEAGSAVAKKQQHNKIENKQEEFGAAERVREAARQKQRDAALDTTLAGMQPAAQTQKLDQATEKRQESFAKTSDQGQGLPGEYVSQSSAPAEVRTETAARVADFLRKGKEETQRRAKLVAFGDTQFDNNVAIGRTGQQLDQLGDYTRGSQNALGTELGGALHAGDDWGLFSDILGAAGMGASLYGFTQPPAAAMDPDMADKLWMHGSSSGAPAFKLR